MQRTPTRRGRAEHLTCGGGCLVHGGLELAEQRTGRAPQLLGNRPDSGTTCIGRGEPEGGEVERCEVAHEGGAEAERERRPGGNTGGRPCGVVGGSTRSVDGSGRILGLGIVLDDVTERREVDGTSTAPQGGGHPTELTDPGLLGGVGRDRDDVVVAQRVVDEAHEAPGADLHERPHAVGVERVGQGPEPHRLHQVAAGQLDGGGRIVGVGRHRRGRPHGHLGGGDGDRAEVLRDARQVGGEQRRVEAGAERQLLGHDLALLGPVERGTDHVGRRADHRLVGAVLVRHVGVVDAGDQSGSRARPAADRGEDDVGDLDRSGLEALEELVDERTGDHPRDDLTGPLTEAVPGDGVGADPEAGQRLGQQAPDDHDALPLRLEVGPT